MFPMINIGPLAIQSGGLILLLSIWIGIWISDRFSKNLGTSSDNIENSILIALLVGIVSARIGFFLRNFNIFLENPLSIFSLSPSMLYVPFGILIGTLSGLIYAQKKGLPNLPTLDTLSPMLLIVFIGFQLANFATGNIYGLPSNLPWAVPLWGAMRHPVQIYAIILALGAFLILVILTKGLKKSGFMRSGILFKLTITTLAIITIFSRAFVDNKALLAGVDTYQLFGFGILLVGLIQLNKLCYQPRKHIGVLISMGANQNPKPNLALALKRLQSDLKVRRFSHFYQTQDVKNPSAKLDFINQLVEVETALSYPDLRAYLKSIEKEFGRVPGNKKQVPLDLDILVYDQDVFSYHGDKIPDPELTQYRYLAQPLAEILPRFRHPASGMPINVIIEQIQDNTKVTKLTEENDGITK